MRISSRLENARGARRQRHRKTKMIERKTLFSDDRQFRYTLWREWKTQAELLNPSTSRSGRTPDRSFVMFIGLNPSTANETENDATVRRCINFAKAWGFGAYCMTNLFAYCTAYPEVLTKAGHPIGEPGNYITVGNAGFGNRNDYWLYLIAQEAAMIVAAWGAFPEAKGRANYVHAMLKGKLHHLGLTRDGSPKHPLYLRSDTQPILWS